MKKHPMIQEIITNRKEEIYNIIEIRQHRKQQAKQIIRKSQSLFKIKKKINRASD